MEMVEQLWAHFVGLYNELRIRERTDSRVQRETQVDENIVRGFRT